MRTMKYQKFIKYFVLIALIVIVTIGAFIEISFSLFSYNAPGRKENIIITGSSNLDQSRANAPVLASNMIPVYYDETNSVWKKADINNSNTSYKWYSYNDKIWANAVTVTSTNRTKYLNAEVGTEIPIGDINTMWVWIPRFKATGDLSTCNGTNDINNPGAFDITFVDNPTTAHEAFTFGTQELNGFWMGKFETTGTSSACTNETCDVSNVTILPNSTPLLQKTIGNYFFMSKSMEQSGNSFGFDKSIDETLDTHVTKNSEWGAVAYLTQSIYGRCSSSTSCKEIGLNNKSSYTTGYGSPAGSNEYSSNGKYNTSLGMNASTTGNIYGVYDMSGGAWEYVMGNYKNFKGFSGFNPFPDSKYYNLYTTSDDYTSANLQHALTETSGWYGDFASFINNTYPWFLRGGYSGFGVQSGIYTFSIDNGSSDSSFGSRFSLVK